MDEYESWMLKLIRERIAAMKNTTVFVTLLLFLTACTAPPESAQKPNLLVIVTDDQGYADLSAFAHSANDISTPNMDRIAQDGVLFT